MSSFQSLAPCTACGTTLVQRTLHHVYTRKAFPEHTNKKWNLIPLCLSCHNNIHSKGTDFMARRYESVKLWLEENGWEYLDFLGKWINTTDNQ